MITDDDLTGMRTVHAGFRAEFGRLAEVFVHPRDPAHAELLEEQLTLALAVLHDHHRHEDDHLWPLLLRGVPSSKDELDELEAEHEQLDPLIAAVADRARPRDERARALGELQLFLRRHVDHEERIAFPLMLRVLTPEHLAADRRKAVADFRRHGVALVFGWIASCLDDDLLAKSVAEQPLLVRALFRLFWWPSYQRRFRELYGAAATVPASALSGAR